MKFKQGDRVRLKREYEVEPGITIPASDSMYSLNIGTRGTLLRIDNESRGTWDITWDTHDDIFIVNESCLELHVTEREVHEAIGSIFPGYSAHRRPPQEARYEYRLVVGSVIRGTELMEARVNELALQGFTVHSTTADDGNFLITMHRKEG